MQGWTGSPQAVVPLIAAALCFLLAGLFGFLALRGVRRGPNGSLSLLIACFALQMVGHAGFLRESNPENELRWSRIVVAFTVLLVPPWLLLVRSVTGKPPARALWGACALAAGLLAFLPTSLWLSVADPVLAPTDPYEQLAEGPLYWAHLVYVGLGAGMGLAWGAWEARARGWRLPGSSAHLGPAAWAGILPGGMLLWYTLGAFRIVEGRPSFAWVAFGIVLLLSVGLLEEFVATHRNLEIENSRVLALNEEIEARRRRETELAAERQKLLEEEVVSLRAELEENTGSGRILGRSPAMTALAGLVRRVAPLDTTVLITGETGTGKELVARELHTLSGRARGPFVAVNVAAMPETLLEAGLFGHVAGAFTGARQSRPGLFERAHGGTLFLDEIGEASPALQSKLLRVLQERVVTRVGASEDISVDVRLIAATHQDLPTLRDQGKFREDLYYRLNVIVLAIPPLRERPGDIPLLAGHFLRRIAGRQGRAIEGFSRKALAALSGYPWPGNVRELEHAVERAVVFASGGQVAFGDLPQTVQGELGVDGHGAESLAAIPVTDSPTLEELERRYVRQVLDQCGGNRADAAKRLGIGERTIYRWLKDRS